MSKIKVMSTALSNRIAAGEVIERPASVVKELVENSIDAGSSFISVEIERAGSKLIAVTDNGCGMDAEDARLLRIAHHSRNEQLRTSRRYRYINPYTPVMPTVRIHHRPTSIIGAVYIQHTQRNSSLLCS